MMFSLLFISCNSDNKITNDGLDEKPVVYELSINEPQYGEFYGDGPIPVSGTVSPPGAIVMIEGVEVASQADGSFSYDVTVERPRAYRIVDVALPVAELDERIPVFTGQDPALTWPGGMSARLLPNGLDVLGATLGGLIDESGWADTITAQLPDVNLGVFGFRPIGVVHEPSLVRMEGASEGLAIDLSLMSVGLEYEIWWFDQNGAEQTGPMYMMFDEVAIGLTAVPSMSEEGLLTFSLIDADLTLDSPDFQFGALEGWLIEWITDNFWTWILEPITENILDTVLAEIGSLDVGGPFAFETDLMGTPLSLGLYDVYGDPDGLALGVELGLGELESDGENILIPTQEDAPDAQLAIGLHEGLMQELVSGQLLSLLSQDLDLGGGFGAIIGNGIMTLPGGDDAPEGDGWCLSLAPSDAVVVRFQEGIEPLAYLFVPDLKVEIGIMDGNDCDDWIVASLAAEIGLVVEDGSVLNIDLKIPEGKLLYYGADGYDEEEVLPALANYLETMIGLVGGFAQIDLGDLLGGGGGMGTEQLPLGDLQLQIIDSHSLWNENPEIEGLYAISLNLWPSE